MSRTYTISAQNITLANTAVTAIFLHSGTTASLEVLRMWASQSASPTSLQQRIQAVIQATAFPTLVSATPAPLNRGDPVSVITGGTAGAAGTCGINASAEGAGAKSVLWEYAFNTVIGWEWVATPDEKIVLPASYASGLGLYFPAAPTNLTNWSFGMTFREI